MSGQAHLSLSSVLSAQWCIKQQQRVKLQIKQFEVPYYVGGSWKTSHIVMYPWTCVRLFGVRRRVSGYPLLSRDPLTKQKIMSKSPLFRLGSCSPLTPAHSGSHNPHNIIVSLSLSLSATLLNHVPSIAHLHGLDNGVMARTARAEANAAINEASTGPSCVLLQVFNYHT